MQRKASTVFAQHPPSISVALLLALAATALAVLAPITSAGNRASAARSRPGTPARAAAHCLTRAGHDRPAAPRRCRCDRCLARPRVANEPGGCSHHCSHHDREHRESGRHIGLGAEGVPGAVCPLRLGVGPVHRPEVPEGGIAPVDERPLVDPFGRAAVVVRRAQVDDHRLGRAGGVVGDVECGLARPRRLVDGVTRSPAWTVTLGSFVSGMPPPDVFRYSYQA